MSNLTLDVDDFMERVQGDKELFFELLDIFKKDFPEKRQSLLEAVANKDREKIEQISHFLKGSCGNISANPLRDIFNDLELKGKGNEMDGLEIYMDKIDKEFEELSVFIEDLRTKLQ